MTFFKPKSVSALNKDLNALLQSPQAKVIQATNLSQEIDKLFNESPAAQVLEECLRQKTVSSTQPQSTFLKPKPCYGVAHTFKSLKLNRSLSSPNNTSVLSPINKNSQSLHSLPSTSFSSSSKNSRNTSSLQTALDTTVPSPNDSLPTNEKPEPKPSAPHNQSDREAVTLPTCPPVSCRTPALTNKENSASSATFFSPFETRLRSSQTKKKFLSLSSQKKSKQTLTNVDSVAKSSNSRIHFAAEPDGPDLETDQNLVQNLLSTLDAEIDTEERSISSDGLKEDEHEAQVDTPDRRKTDETVNDDTEADDESISEADLIDLGDSCVVLEEWVIQIYPDGVQVEGHRRGDDPEEFWHSSKICERLSAKILKTGSGSIYRLVGDIDEGTAKDQGGLTDELIESFRFGFPPDWETIIKKHKEKPPRPKKKKSLDSRNLAPSKDVSKNNFDEPKKPKKTPKHNTSCPNTMNKTKQSSQKKKTTKHSSSFSVSEMGTKEDPMVLSKMPTTRSGRPIVPQLAWWTNQRLVVSPINKFADVIQGTPNSLSGYQVLNFKEEHLTSEQKTLIKALERKKRQKASTSSKKATKRSNDSSTDDKNTGTEVKRKVLKPRKRDSSSKAKIDSTGTGSVTGDLSEAEVSAENEAPENRDLKRTMEQLEMKDFALSSTGSSPGRDEVLQIPVSEDSADEIQQADGKARTSQPRHRRNTDKRTLHKSPNIILENVLHVQKNTPQMLLKKALENLPEDAKNRRSLRSYAKEETGKKSDAQEQQERHEEKQPKSKRKRHSREVDHTKSSAPVTVPAMSTAAKKSKVKESTRPQADVLFGVLEDVSEDKPRRRSKSRARSKEQSAHERPLSRTSSKPTEEPQPDTDASKPWTAEEIQRYKTASAELPLSVPWYWEALAASVGTRSEQECRDFHFKDAPSSEPKKKVSKAKTSEPVTNPSQITGTKGTLKRKRQIRELVENHDKDYTDDIFGSTPYRGTKTIPMPDMSQFCAGLADDFRTPSAHRTPHTKRSGGGDAFETPSQHLVLPPPLSEKKTPAGSLISPGFIQSVDRDNLDTYVHRMRKHQKGRKWGVLPAKATPSVKRTKQHQQKKIVADSIATELFNTREEADYGDSDQDDYYFSD